MPGQLDGVRCLRFFCGSSLLWPTTGILKPSMLATLVVLPAFMFACGCQQCNQLCCMFVDLDKAYHTFTPAGDGHRLLPGVHHGVCHLVHHCHEGVHQGPPVLRRLSSSTAALERP